MHSAGDSVSYCELTPAPFVPTFRSMKWARAIPKSFLLAAAVFALSPATSVFAQTALDRALAELRASDTEWRRERDLYRSQRQSGLIKAEQAAEYAEFVSLLQRQKLENCENVRNIGGDDALKNTDCVIAKAESSGSTQKASLPEPAKTDAEQAGSLDEQLKVLEAELDKELSGAQQRSRAKTAGRVARLPGRDGSGNRPSDRPANGTGADQSAAPPKWSDPGPEKDRDGDGSGETAATGDPSEAKEAGDQTDPNREGVRDPGAGAAGEEKEKSAKADSSAGENGDEDDVVLRQIREAAEKETDPVLKEKLWEEYRKMKAPRS